MINEIKITNNEIANFLAERNAREAVAKEAKRAMKKAARANQAAVRFANEFK